MKEREPTYMLVDYARFYKACVKMGIAKPLDLLYSYATKQRFGHMYIWGFNYGGTPSSLQRKVEHRTSKELDVVLSEVPLDSVTPSDTEVSGRVLLGGAENNAIFKLPRADFEVCFDTRLAYTAGVIASSIYGEGLPSILFVSNAPSLLACAEDLSSSGLSAAFAFPLPELGGDFYKEKQRVAPRLKVIALEEYVINKNTQHSSDAVFKDTRG